MTKILPAVSKVATELFPTCYKDLTTFQLVEKMFLLKLCGMESFVQSAHKLHGASAQVLGERLTNMLMQTVMVKHFVAGDKYEQLHGIAKRMLSFNVKTMMVPPMENIGAHFDQSVIDACIANKDKYIKYFDVLKRLSDDLQTPNVTQFKLSAVMPSFAMNYLSKLCETKQIPLADMGFMVGDYYLHRSEKILGHIDDDRARLAVELGLTLSRNVFEAAIDRSIPVLIDAELKSAHTAMYAIYLGAEMLIQRKITLYVTFQCYMKGQQEVVQETLDASRALNVPFGAKVVRGAYLQLERELAKTAGLSDPTWPTFDATSKCNNAVVKMLIDDIGNVNSNETHICVATHNLESVAAAKGCMTANKLPRSCSRISFGQIYGMCDHITFDLGLKGYNVYKSTPYGPGKEWIPYLARRAAENHTAITTARTEIPFYRQELRRRYGL